jgi:hypothetical protein
VIASRTSGSAAVEIGSIVLFSQLLPILVYPVLLTRPLS